jgi:two-component sensor histidine kinase
MRSRKGRYGARTASGPSLGLVLIGSTIIVCSLALGAMMLLTSRAVTQNLGAELSEKNTLLARSVARSTSSFLEGYFAALSTLAAEPDARTMKTLASAFPAFTSLMMVSPEGRVSLAMGGDSEVGYDVSKRGFFRDPPGPGGFSLSDSSMSRRSYHPTVYLSLHSRDALAVGELDLQSLSSYIGHLALRKDELAAIADARGTLVAHSDGRRVERSENVAWEPQVKDSLLQEGSTAREMDFEGRRVLLSAARVPGSDWMAIVAVPTAEGERVIARLRDSLMAATSIMVALILAAAIAVLSYIGRDFTNFTARLHALASGDYEVPEREPGFKEFRSLGMDFRFMADAVRNREQRLFANLEQKEALIREVHHRVKNNLQLVQSILSLGMRHIADEEAVSHFDRAIARIDALASVHEMLYYTDNIARLRFDNYLRSLAGALLDPAQLHIESEEVVLDMDRAIPGGLIANELITNAIKHGGKAAPLEVSVTLSIEKAGEASLARLDIEDNGPGFPEGFSPAQGDSLGLRLVVSLVQQLRGSWELSSGRGARWTIRFPIRLP